MKFNPVNFVISLVIGWFVISFLQALVMTFINGEWNGLYSLFQEISFFRNGTGITVNLIAIAVLATVGTVIWFKTAKKE